MIHYPFTQSHLEGLIDAAKETWRVRAAARTANFVTAGKYNESSNIWGEIKEVYTDLQRGKCAFCERQLASSDFGGNVEHDVEHYRGKNTVIAWPTPAIAAERGISYSFATGPAFDNGYYWLAYHVLNYCISCKKCNSPLKHNYFPIAGPRGAVAGEPADLNETEKPLLIFPLGELDENPEELIGFVGVTAIPKKKNRPTLEAREGNDRIF